jgi:hypothetical protein
MAKKTGTGAAKAAPKKAVKPKTSKIARLEKMLRQSVTSEKPEGGERVYRIV